MKQERHQARILAMQALYQLDLQNAGRDPHVGELMAPLIAEAGVSGDAAAYARLLVMNTWASAEKYDKMIAGASQHWNVSRMAVVDRNILRLALYEMIEQPDVPVRVVIDEAIEMGKEFGTAESPQFINGVLDAVWKNHPAARIARGSADAPKP